MAELSPPARITDVLPGGDTYPDHVRVLVLCSCGGLTDVTYSADQPPESIPCTGCGAQLAYDGGSGGGRPPA
jgi:hypothetical protein